MAALPAPFCALASVTMHNNDAVNSQFLDGGYTIAPSSSLVIDFTLLSIYGKGRQAAACNNADAGGVLVISAHS